MVAKRRSRRRGSEDSEELGLEGAKKPAKTAPPASEDEASEVGEESDNSGDAPPLRNAPPTAARKPKGTPQRAKKPSPLPSEGAGARGSGQASPARDAPTDQLDVAPPPPRKKTKKTAKRVKRPPSPSQEERAQDEVEESGDPSMVSKAPAEDTAAVLSPGREVAAPPGNARKRAKRGPTPMQEEEEQAGKRAAGADGGDGIGKPLSDKVNHKTEKKKKLHKVLAEAPQSDSPGLELTKNREEVPDACNTSNPQEKDNAPEEKRQGEMVEQGHAGDTAPPQMDDGAEEEEQQVEEVAGHADNPILPQHKDGAHEDGDLGVEVSGEALPEGNASSPKMCTSDGEKKPEPWSQDDELKILTALVEHAQSHQGALPDSSDLLASLTFDKTDANADKLNDKIRKLRARYRKLSSQGRPTDDLGRQLFDLSDFLWGQDDDDVQVDETFVTRDRDFAQLSSLYPYLAEEVKVYAEEHISGNLILAALPTICDDQARQLDAMCKKQRLDAFNLELGQAKLTKALLSVLSRQIN